MDLNMIVLCGRIVAEPEVDELVSGSVRARLRLTVRSDHPGRRIDVLPVTCWDPPAELWEPTVVGRRVWVAGSLQRRFWDAQDGRRSRIDVVARSVWLMPCTGAEEEDAPV
jgi:single-stranded DNA-binding protein